MDQNQIAGPPMTYVAPLDGLRAVSIALVLLSHFGISFIPGIFGVTVFFFISGFLITGQLMRELSASGTINLGNFYVRRILRLYPALLVFVVIGGLLLPIVGTHVSAMDMAAALGYGANFWEEHGGFNAASSGTLHPYNVLWSLAVEEHYYFVFPLLLLAISRRTRALSLVIGALIVAIGLWRLELFKLCTSGALACGDFRILHGTDTRVDSILFGSFFAIMLQGEFRTRTLRWAPNIALTLLGVTLLFLSVAIRNPWFRDTVRFDVQGVGLFLCLGGLLFNVRLGLARTALSWKPILVLGRLSYSLYLTHWLVLSLFSAIAPPGWTRPLFATGLPPAWWLVSVLPSLILASVGLAVASYYLVERPMISLRRRFGSEAVADRAAMTATGHAVA